MRRATTLAALLGALATLGGGAAPALAAKQMDVTLQDDGVFVVGGSYSRETALQQTAALGVTRIRANLRWAASLPSKQAKSRKAPGKPAYNWAPYDSLIDAAAAHGMRVDLTLVGEAPAYATKNHKIGMDAPSATRFASFARAAAKHFKGRVNRYSIWNEPNLRLWLAPHAQAPKLYRGLYTAAYNAIHHADRKAQVLIGETAPYGQGARTTAPLKFLRAVTCVDKKYKKRRKACKPLITDGYAAHPYDFHHKPSYKLPGADNVTVGTLSNLTGALTKLRKLKALYTPEHGTPGVYLSEYGYYRGVPKGCSRTEHKRQISDAKDAKYTVQAFKLAQRNPSVKSMLQYTLLHSEAACFATGIVSPSGKPSKVYTALQRWSKSAARKGQIRKRPKRIRLPAAR